MSEAIVPTRIYVRAWVSLVVLLGITIAASYIHMGWLNGAVAIVIAFMKALIIVLYFMHVRYSPRLIWVFAGAGILWLGIMFSLSMADYHSRALLPAPAAWLR
jgi:cytochrome c oxidase subunit 4